MFLSSSVILLSFLSRSLSLSLDAKSTSLEVSVRLGYALARHPNLLDAIWRLIWFPRVLALYIFISLQLMVPFTLGPFFFLFLWGERVLLLPWLVSMLFPLCILFSREYIMTRAMRIFDHAACVSLHSAYMLYYYIYRPQYIVHQFDCPYDFEYI